MMIKTDAIHQPKTVTAKKPVWGYWLGAVLLILLVALFSFLRYQPALTAAPGYIVHNVTDPGWLNGRLKTIQAISEQLPCTYTLLGWQAEDTLYYQSTCAGTEQIWRYSMVAKQAERGVALPPDLVVAAVPIATIEDSLLANVYPRELATVSRQTFMAGNPLVSANGGYTALVSRHVYGPQDVLVLTAADQ